ncbi:MAG TPA: polysaccharide pyruvyl transferase CsaB [Oscillospiraceae bacterium]|nr:polysaccharide pyruvyl transferase CsaB [Oscillospiraceae bacterium]
MKIIHLISGGDTGGAKTHVFSLLQGLKKTEDVVLVCFRDGPFAGEARALGIPTEIIAGRGLFRTLERLKRFVLAHGCDIVHCHGARGNLMGCLLKRSLHLPTVTTVHSDYRLDYLGRPFHALTYGVINTVALRLLDYRIGVSDAMQDLLISRGFPPDTVFAIYNGIDFTPRERRAGPAEYWRSVGLDADEESVVVGIAARLNPVKDIATLIRAFAIAEKSCPRLRLLIAGDGPEESRLRALSDALGVAPKVCFAGWVGDMDSFYQSIHINTLTSLSETFPYALTEGAREKLATVASRVGGVPYLIDDGADGLLFPAGDAEALAAHLVRLAKDPALRETLGRRLYEKSVEKFSIDRTTRTQLAIYRAILRRRVRPKGRDGVLLCGAYGKNNMGDDAILKAILSELREIDPDMPLHVLSRRPRQTRLTCRVPASYTFNFPVFLTRMRRVKLYLNGGGSLMQDITSRRSLWYYLFTLRAAKKRGAKVIMYGCGIGPLLYERDRKWTTSILNRYVDVITLRDPHSQQFLATLGITKPEIRLAADPTVSLPTPSPALIDGLFSRFGLDPSAAYISFTVRDWPGYAEKAQLIGAAADYAYFTYGLIPLFLPIERRIDVPASRLAAEHMRAPYRILDGIESIDMTVGAFSRMEIAVSMRLHALVFGARVGIPLVGMVYDPKVSAFLASIGQDLYTQLEKLTLEGLENQIDRAMERRRDPGFLRDAVERLRKLEGENSAAARRLLEDHSR